MSWERNKRVEAMWASIDVFRVACRYVVGGVTTHVRRLTREKGEKGTVRGEPPHTPPL